MTECAGCHRLGQSMGTLAPRDPGYRWYVRASFRHEQHASDPRTGQMTPCLLCHDQVVTATRLGEIGRPRMPQCDACHDGKIAFKTTGFGCARCHTQDGGR
jgi:c(7)-type cytochrome triheme protein